MRVSIQGMAATLDSGSQIRRRFSEHVLELEHRPRCVGGPNFPPPGPSILRPFQQLRQPRNIHRYPPAQKEKPRRVNQGFNFLEGTWHGGLGGGTLRLQLSYQFNARHLAPFRGAQE
jgi:hypothetical protein